MELKRKKAKRKGNASYPNIREAKHKRRDFLRILGKGLLAAPLLSLARCTEGIGKMVLGDAEDGYDEPDWQLMGVAPYDMVEQPPDIKKKNEEDWQISGGVGIDPDAQRQEEDWQVAGDLGVDIGEEEDYWASPGGPFDQDINTQPDVPPLPGEAPEPDLKPEPDTGEWPIDGDMPMPEEDVKSQVDAKADTGFPPLDGDMDDPDW